MARYGNTAVAGSITVIGQKFRSFKALQSLQLQLYVINPVDRDAGDAFASDLGASIADMSDTLTAVSLDMSCDVVTRAQGQHPSIADNVAAHIQ